MNLEKAREYFSAYNEGTLERGLKEAFERALRTDAQIQAEYRAFERLITDLETLKTPVPEPEMDLHEAISRRLDLHIHEEKRRTPIGIFGWWKSVALGGLATGALVLTVLQLQSNDISGGPTRAGLPVSTFSEKLEVKSTAHGYQLEYSTHKRNSIVVRSASGAVLSEKTIEGGTFTAPVRNENEKPTLLTIQVGSDEPVYLALPGKRISAVREGEGSLKDLALSLAGFYRQPVMLTLGEDVKVKWALAPGSAVAAATNVLNETQYSATEQVEGGVIAIQPN